MASHRDVAQAWANGRKLKGNSMYSDGFALYSWGEHFPICATIRGITLFNTDSYSVSTGKHQSIARGVCGSVVECTTSELQNAIRYPDDAIIIKKKVHPADIDEALDILRNTCKDEGMKRFPMKQLKEILKTKIFLERL